MTNLRSRFFLLLSFTSGSFLMWMVIMSTLEEYNILLQERVKLNANYAIPKQGKLRKLHNPNLKTNATKLHNPNLKTNETRVLCWVLTSPDTLRTRAIGIKKTWGPRCDVTLYMSSETDPDFPAVGLDVKEGRAEIWNKNRAAIMYVYKHHFNDADWFMKADDDTYVIVENLRDFLRDKDSSKPVYYGHHLKKFVQQGYMSGGAGYVMSKEALRSMVVKQLQMPDKTRSCEFKKKTKSEDVWTGLCLEMAGVIAGDSRDAQNKSRFLPLNIEHFFNMQLPEWYHRFSKHKSKLGSECCSDSLISIHCVTSPESMALLDYYIYHLRKSTT